MTTEVDYYELLECERTADDATLKSAYRKLAIKYHPDKNSGCKDSEAKFKAVCPYASQFMVFGNERNYCVALVTLDPDAVVDWAKENGVSGDYSTIVADAKTHEMVQGYVDELNNQLNRWETIKKFELLDHDLSVESGELTPSMKVKRNVVEDNYGSLIDKMYA